MKFWKHETSFNLIGSLTFYYKNIECANDNVIMS